jgi:uncharacterized repeat protein (TIGR03943 family)
MLAVGSVLMSLTVSGGFQSYVRIGLRVPLLLAGLCLLAIGGRAVVVRPPTAVADDGHGHGNATMRVGMSLLAFVAAVYLIAPAPLGSYAAGRGNENRIPMTAPRTELTALTAAATESTGPAAVTSTVIEITTTVVTTPAVVDEPVPLPPPTTEPVEPAQQPAEVTAVVAEAVVPEGDVVEMSLYDFLTYTLFAPDDIRGVPLRLIGFAAEEPEVAGTYRLTRFMITCCAADAYPLQVIVEGSVELPPNDQWLEVEGVWVGEMVELDEFTQIPILHATTEQPIEAPSQPYEY